MRGITIPGNFAALRMIAVLAMLFTGTLVPAQSGYPVIFLYDGPAPGSESWDWEEQEAKMGQATFAYNVVSPSLTVFEADPEKATGIGIIVCPGGGFHFLSMDNEGFAVARWLNERGITAFVMKYRLVHCETDNPMAEFMAKGPNSEKFNRDIEPTVAMDLADGRAAVAYVREHAAQWGLKTDRIGIMGFSAGGTVTTGVSFTYEQASRPDFAAPIYPYVGSFGDPPVPEDAPPLFIAAATDDTFGFQTHCTKLYDRWVSAGHSAELHIYRTGSHGFGMQHRGIPTDGWIDLFYEWISNLYKP
jgi:acetyl esterase/lipase